MRFRNRKVLHQMIFEIYTPWAQKQNPVILNQAQQSEEFLHKDIDFSLHSFAQNDIRNGGVRKLLTVNLSATIVLGNRKRKKMNRFFVKKVCCLSSAFCRVSFRVFRKIYSFLAEDFQTWSFGSFASRQKNKYFKKKILT